MTKLILIRHGQSEANLNNICAGQIDPDLTEKGILQAKATTEYIKNNYKIDKIYSSDLKRAYKTAKCLSEALSIDIISEKKLREINAGKWEGIVFDKLSSMYPEDHYQWINDIGNARCTGGESVKELGERVMDILLTIAKENEGKTVAIATHATVIRVVQSLIKTNGVSEMKNIPWVSNASITILEYDNGVWKVVLESFDEHLKDLVTLLPQNA